MKKRGISTVVATVLLILISIVAITLLWFFISNFLKKSSSGVDTSCLTLDLSIQKVEINSSSSMIYVQVQRGTGEGNLSGIKFKFYNSSASILRDKATNMRELEIRTFSFDDIENVSSVNKVEVAPVVFIAGKNESCRISDYSKSIGIYTAPCTPDCTGRVCGLDPVCGKSCGSCGAETSILVCKGNDVYRNITTHTCVSGACQDIITEEFVEACSNGCENGACKSAPYTVVTYLPNSTGSSGWSDGTSGDEGKGGLYLLESCLTNALTATQLNTISNDNSTTIVQSGAGGTSSAFLPARNCFMLRFNISENPSEVTQIDVLMKHLSVNDTNGNVYNLSLYIYNVTGTGRNWTELARQTYPKTNTYYNQIGTITLVNAPSNYINVSGGNKYIYILGFMHGQAKNEATIDQYLRFVQLNISKTV